MIAGRTFDLTLEKDLSSELSARVFICYYKFGKTNTQYALW